MRPKPHRFLGPQLWRLPKRHAVTIGLGFRCIDGMVLCSDSQLTKYDLKFPGTKIHIIVPEQVWEGEEWIVAMCYAGHEPIERRVFESLSNRLLGNGKPSVASARAEIEDVLAHERKQNLAMVDRLEMLFAISISNDNWQLLRSHGKIVTPVDTFHAIGIGDSSLIRFLRDLFAMHPQFMQTEECVMLGTYMVGKAKKFIEGCGGETQALIVLPNGQLRPVFGKTIEFREAYLSKVEREFTQLISSLTNPRLDTQFTEQRIDEFSTAIKQIGKITQF
jgi:hypothetical protein